jgi:putative endonuclease
MSRFDNTRVQRGRFSPAQKKHKRIQAERRGRLAETLCVAQLRLTGWRILARRLKANAGTGLGEVDIIAQRGRVISFIEVKARLDATAALDAVTALQRVRIARAADAFIQRRPECADCEVRFDVMIVGSGFLPKRIADAWRPELP